MLTLIYRPVAIFEGVDKVTKWQIWQSEEIATGYYTTDQTRADQSRTEQSGEQVKTGGCSGS